MISIIKRPWISEKATFLAEKGKYIFLVDPNAKGKQIKDAIENIYKVHVTGINIVRNRHKGDKGGKTMKKAIATLKKGETIDIMPH